MDSISGRVHVSNSNQGDDICLTDVKCKIKDIEGERRIGNCSHRSSTAREIAGRKEREDSFNKAIRINSNHVSKAPFY